MSRSDKQVSFRNDYEKNSEKVQKEHLISPNSSFQKLDVSSKLDIWSSPVAYGEGDIPPAKIHPTLRLITRINHSFKVPLSLSPDYQGITSSEYVPGF